MRFPAHTRSSLALFFLVCVTLSSLAQTASAQSADRATTLYLEADFAGAESAARRTLAARASDADELARAHALLAVLLTVDGDRDADEVERSMVHALALDPTVTVPEGAPRAIAARFEEIRAAQEAEPMALSITLDAAGGERVVWARIEGAPAGLVESVTLSCQRGSDAPREGVGHVVIDAGESRCEARALTPQGQLVRRRAHEFAAEPGAGAAAGSDDTAWIVLGVVAGVLVVGATVGLVVGLTASESVSLGTPRVLEW